MEERDYFLGFSLAKGAKLVLSAQDILNEFNIKNTIQKTKTNLGNFSKEEGKIMNILENDALHFDEIVRRLSLDPSVLGSTLSILEVKGLIKSLDGGYFKLV